MDDDVKSRTQKKNEARALQKLGEQLLTLTPEQLDNIDMPPELREAVGDAFKTTRHGARRRQIKYIGMIMREIDPDPIRRAFANLKLGDRRKVLAFKKIEAWRDELMEGNLVLIHEILKSCPDAERQRLTQLARNAHLESNSSKGVKAGRALFRYLKQVSEL
jgi:ribosome-associated protein